MDGVLLCDESNAPCPATHLRSPATPADADAASAAPGATTASGRDTVRGSAKAGAARTPHARRQAQGDAEGGATASTDRSGGRPLLLHR